LKWNKDIVLTLFFGPYEPNSTPESVDTYFEAVFVLFFCQIQNNNYREKSSGYNHMPREISDLGRSDHTSWKQLLCPGFRRNDNLLTGISSNLITATIADVSWLILNENTW